MYSPRDDNGREVVAGEQDGGMGRFVGHLLDIAHEHEKRLADVERVMAVLEDRHDERRYTTNRILGVLGTIIALIALLASFSDVFRLEHREAGGAASHPHPAQ